MKKENNKVKPLSEFEEDLLYMSYRYAIGRHTIHAHSHACNIIEHFYERLLVTPNRMQFTSKDINRSIEDCLRFGRLNVYLHDVYDRNIHILESLIHSIIDERGYVKYDIRYVNKIILECYSNDGDCDIMVSTSEKIENEYPWNDIDDLMIWYYMAKLFDLKSHKVCTLTDGTECEFIELYQRQTEYSEDRKNDKVKFIKFRVPVKKFINNPYVWTYIPDESIDWNKPIITKF